MDVWISTYTDAQTISNYTNKIILNYVCYTQVLQLTPLSVTINCTYGVSCTVTFALLPLSVQLYENGRS